MSNEIEQTRRAMYKVLSSLGHLTFLAENRDLKTGQSATLEFQLFQCKLEEHFEAVSQDRGLLVEERDALRNRVQVLASANKIAGERLRVVTEGRETLSAISHHETQQNASCATLDAKTAAILGSVVDVQRIVTDWATKGLKAKEAMRLVAGVVNGEPCYSAMLPFERKAEPEVTLASIAAVLSNLTTREDGAINKALKDLMVNGIGAYHMTVGDNGVEVTTLSAEELLADNDLSFTNATGFCQHEFRPAAPATETCTYCGLAK